MSERQPPPENNGNDIKTAFKSAEAERREREIKAIEKHLQENGGSEENSEPHASVKKPRATNQKKVRSQRYSPRIKPVRDYDEDGRPAVRPDTRLHSWEPEIKKEPELNRKGSRRKKHKISEAIDTRGFEQIETKHGASWTEPESTPREPRVRPPVAVEINDGPTIQIETKSVSNPEAGTPVAQTSAEVKPPQTPATTPETEADRLVNQANEAILTRNNAERSAKEKFEERAAEVTEMLKGQNVGGIDPIFEARMYMDFGRDEQAFEILEEIAKKVADGTYTAITQSAEPAREPAKSINGIEPAIKSEIDVEMVTAIPNPDKPTVGESRSKLREAVGKLVEKTKEKFDWYKSSKEHLIRRNSELNAEAENVKGFEKMFRKLGESYNKMGWKSKLVIGAGLGLGAGLSGAAVSGVGILGFTTLIVAQRSAALATMYLKYEKKATPDGEERSADASWWHIGAKEKAFLKAALYTAAMTAGTAEAIKEIRESAWAQDVNGWLGHMMEKVADKFEGTVNHSEAGAIATAPNVFPEKVQIQSDSAPPEQPAPVAEAPVPAPAPEVVEPAGVAAESPAIMPEVSVEATRGKGYEYMAKRLWDKLPDNLDASNFPEGSDIRALLEADENSIKKVVHELAEKHGLFKPDGTSVQINLGDKLSFDTNGSLQVGNGETFVNAPEGALVTPPYPSEQVPVHPPPPEVRAMFQGVENASPAPETDAPVTSPEPEEFVIKQPTGAPMIDVTGEQSTAEVPTEASTSAQEIVTNSSGLSVPTTESHVYSGNEDRLYVFGGTTADHSKTIREFFSEPENAKKILYTPPVTGGSHVIGWIKNPDGAIMSNGPLEADERNWFGMRKYVEKIELDMLRKKIN